MTQANSPQSPPTTSTKTLSPTDSPTVTSPDCLRGGGKATDRTPPGQRLSGKWPVLHYGSVAHLAKEDWSLHIWGLVENEIKLDWQAFNELPKVNVRCDIHCVTHWSRLDNVFHGVSTSSLMALAKPLPHATHVVQHAPSDPGDDWTTNLPLNEFTDEDCLLATHHDGEPLTAEHGAPVHAIVPRLYFWKGAKWITEIEVTDEDRAGFWEVNGYHMHGDPWTEERFSH